jgi:hypothetical protein
VSEERTDWHNFFVPQWCHVLSNPIYFLNCRVNPLCAFITTIMPMKSFFTVVTIVLFSSSAFAQSLVNNTKKQLASNEESVSASNSSKSTKASLVSLSEVSKNIGNTVTVCGKVYSARLLKNVIGQPTLMNLGGEYANEKIEVRINFSDLPKFDYKPEKLFLHKHVCITGTITDEHGFAEIRIDTINARKLINEALNTELDTTKSKVQKLRLLSNAYLLAGDDLDEPIITHLKAGSVVIPEYSTKGYTYVKVIEKAGTGEQPQWMCGFIRNQAIGFTRNGRLVSEEKKLLGIRLIGK